MLNADREARRRAADAANGCAALPKPVGKPRDLVLAELRKGPRTKAQLREATGLSCGDSKAAIASLIRDGSIWSKAGVWSLR